MNENIGGAGPALAAHSKDGSAIGQTPASKLTGRQQPGDYGDYSAESLGRMASQLGELIRRQPVISAAVAGVVGLCLGRMLGRQ